MAAARQPLYWLMMLHVLAAAVLVGGVAFNYFILRPAQEKVPPAQQAVLGEGVGRGFVYLVWSCLGTLLLTGVAMLWLLGDLPALASGSLFTRDFGRTLAVKFLLWLAMAVIGGYITLVLQPLLLRKLSPATDPDLAELDRRRSRQLKGKALLERLVLVNVVLAPLAAVLGISLLFGGLI